MITKAQNDSLSFSWQWYTSCVPICNVSLTLFWHRRRAVTQAKNQLHIRAKLWGSFCSLNMYLELTLVEKWYFLGIFLTLSYLSHKSMCYSNTTVRRKYWTAGDFEVWSPKVIHNKSIKLKYLTNHFVSYKQKMYFMLSWTSFNTNIKKLYHLSRVACKC